MLIYNIIFDDKYMLLQSILVYVDGSVQSCRNSIANAMELLQFCTKPSMCKLQWSSGILTKIDTRGNSNVVK